MENKNSSAFQFKLMSQIIKIHFRIIQIMGILTNLYEIDYNYKNYVELDMPFH